MGCGELMFKKLLKSSLFLLVLFSILASNVFSFDVPTAEHTADSYDSLLMHLNGTDASTTMPDSSTNNAKGNATVNGNAQLDTAIVKFGTAALLLDGTGDYINYANSVDYDFGNPAAAFTIEYWCYITDTTSYDGHITSSGNTAGNYAWVIYTNGSGVLRCDTAGITADTITSGNQSITVNQWDHVAFICKGSGATDVNFYVNGTAGNAPGTGNKNFNSNANGIAIGRVYHNEDSFYAVGSFDEIRISKGIARFQSVARRIIIISYGLDIGDYREIGTPLWSCKIKALKLWKNFQWKYLRG